MKTMNLKELLHLAPAPYWRAFRRWYYRKAEQHYLMSAQIEEQKAREHSKNVAYYQKLAVLARSAQHE